MHTGYCEVYSYSFRLFLDAWSESSWNSLFVLKERKFQGTKVPGTFAPEEQKFQGANVPWNKSATGMKVPSVDFSLLGTKVRRNDRLVYDGQPAICMSGRHVYDGTNVHLMGLHGLAR